MGSKTIVKSNCDLRTRRSAYGRAPGSEPASRRYTPTCPNPGLRPGARVRPGSTGGYRPTRDAAGRTLSSTIRQPRRGAPATEGEDRRARIREKRNRAEVIERVQEIAPCVLEVHSRAELLVELLVECPIFCAVGRVSVSQLFLSSSSRRRGCGEVGSA